MKAAGSDNWLDLRERYNLLQTNSRNDIMPSGGVDMDFTGASGAISRGDKGRMDAHAKLFYDEIRTRIGDVEAIAQNTGFPVADVQKAKEHVFINRYMLEDLEPERFAPDYDMAVSWQRLIEGKNIQEMDIVMLKHEIMEYSLMNDQDVPYSDAHKIATEQYNYIKYIIDLDRKEGVK